MPIDLSDKLNRDNFNTENLYDDEAVKYFIRFCSFPGLTPSVSTIDAILRVSTGQICCFWRAGMKLQDYLQKFILGKWRH